MKYTDRIYGPVEIVEPVILELIKSSSLQRLKGIDQAGYKPLWEKPDTPVGKHEHSRFGHSVGVYLLLKKYGAPLEEQIAGLIHDVSHSAFSHAGDYVFAEGSPKEHSHQDNIFEAYVKNSEIPKILKKYEIDLDYVLDDNNFPLKETQLPDLCADRIDYSLRTAVIFGELDEKGKDDILAGLTARNNRWIFKNSAIARQFAELFFKLNKVYYSGLSSAGMFQITSDLLRYAIEEEYIQKSDLYSTDAEVLEKIRKFLDQDEKLELLWSRMQGRVKFSHNENDYDAQVFCKSRIVDPWYEFEGTIKRVSDIFCDWREVLKREMKPKEYLIKFLK